MPKRLEYFCKGRFYHIFNKTIDHKAIFLQQEMYLLFKKILGYYQFESISEKFSESKRRKTKKPEKLFLTKQDNNRIFSCLAYCFMPNHFHLLLRQNGDIALNKVLHRVFISFTRTYNLLKKRQGPLFLPQFKVVEINSQEQLLHVSRYIHLNPYSSAIIDLKTIPVCPLTSMPVYQRFWNDFCEPDIILANFDNNPKKYLDFVLDNAEYQRKLEISKKYTAS